MRTEFGIRNAEFGIKAEISSAFRLPVSELEGAARAD